MGSGWVGWVMELLVGRVWIWDWLMVDCYGEHAITISIAGHYYH